MAIKMNDDGSKTVTLDFPIAGADGAQLAEITLRRPNAAQLRKMDQAKGEVGRSLALLQALTQIPMPFLERLDGSDYLELQDAINGFLKKSPATGDE